jgi:hypothetical protein
MYQTIDRTLFGDIPWSSFSLQYSGEKPTDNVPAWMNATYEICYLDPRLVIYGMLTNPDFQDHMDFVPYRKYDAGTHKRQWQDFMLGEWAWMQAVRFCSYLFNSFITLRDRMKSRWTL